MSRRHTTRASAASKLHRVEELLVASSGEDAFEIAYALAAAHLFARRRKTEPPCTPRTLPTMTEVSHALVAARRAWPWLEAALPGELPGLDRSVAELALRVLAEALAADDGLDALFEVLAPRVGKGDKGQYFTPRSVVGFVLRALRPISGERVLDPACGSGAFVSAAHDLARVRSHGVDVDGRAVRVARLLAASRGRDPKAIERADALQPAFAEGPKFDVIATNPPFAGEVRRAGFASERVVARPERDALFVERCLDRLRPGGRLGILLPYNKVGSRAWGRWRVWIASRARIFAVVSLPRETFLPHTGQRAVVVFAKQRATTETPPPGERVLLASSERAGKDAAGEPIARAGGEGWLATAHDLDDVLAVLAPFLADEGFFGVRSRVFTFRDLGSDLVLAPERHLRAAIPRGGATLGDLVTVVAERVMPAEITRARTLVLDTTHAKDGVIDVRSAARVTATPESAKKRLAPGDLVVSRLRPYLRQIALVHPRALALSGHTEMCGSTELVVLRAARDGESIAYLLPWLLSDTIQCALADGQEGGHHPRVALDTLLALPVPARVIRGRARQSERVERALARVYEALAVLDRLVR